MNNLMQKIFKLYYKDVYKPLVFIFFGLTVLFLLISLWSLRFFPIVFIDEPWFSDTAWNFIHGGGLSETMNQGILDRSLETRSRWPLLGSLPYIVFFKIFGLGLFQGRLASWLIGIVLLITVYLFTKKFYNSTSAALAVLLLAISWPFLQASHYIRPDITLTLMVLLALYFYLSGLNSHKNWLFLLAGLLIGLSVDVHPNGILFALVLSILHIFIFRKTIFKSPATWFFVSGAAIAILYYFGFRYGFDFKLALKLSPVESKILPPPLTTLNPKEIIKAFYHEFGRLNAYNHPLDFVLIGASLFYILGRRGKIDRFILWFLALGYVLMALMAANKNQIYTILYYPFFAIIIAETFVSAMRDKKIIAPEGMFWGGLLLFCLAAFSISIIRPIVQARDYNYDETSRKIKQIIPDNSKTLGMPNWWLGLSETDYHSILGITYLHILDGKSLTEALEVLDPEYIIVDPALRARLVDQGYFALGSFDAYLFPRQEFEAYLSQKAKEILEYKAPLVGLIEVYQVDNDR